MKNLFRSVLVCILLGPTVTWASLTWEGYTPPPGTTASLSSFEPINVTLNHTVSYEADGYTRTVEAGESFLSFCLEYRESPTNAMVAEISKAAVLGDGSMSDPQIIAAVQGKSWTELKTAYNDPISSATAHLYKDFLAGTVTASGVDTQSAIWIIEDEVDNVSLNTLGWTSNGQALANQYKSLYPGQTDLGGVRVLNLFSPDTNLESLSYSNLAQDILIYGEGTPAVPVPGAMALAGLGTCIATFIKRRFQGSVAK